MLRLLRRPLHGGWPLIVLCTAGCASTPTEVITPPPPTFRIEVLTGASQSGVVGDSLDFPILIRVTDQSGLPLMGQRVAWISTNGGSDEDTTRTDADGRTSVRFVLGEEAGKAQLMVHPIASTTTTTLEFAVLPDPSDDPLISFDPFLPLDLKTYDGSNETVHPDYVSTPSGSFLVITPYPQGNRTFENPSFYSGTGSWRWRAPTGLRNPVVLPPASSYLSDPDAVYNAATDEIWLYYRQVDESNDIYLTRTTKGVKWSTPTLAISAPRDQLVSPSVVRRGPTDWLMWAVDAGSYGCTATATRMTLRHSSDGVKWGPPVEATLSQGAPMPWHLEVQWIPSRGEYWALYSAKPSGSCGTPAMMFARSSDGLSWSVNEQPIVVRGMNEAIRDVVYRATFRYDSATDDLRLWISGASGINGAYSWRTVYERIKGSTVLEASTRLVNPWTFTPSMPLLTQGP